MSYNTLDKFDLKGKTVLLRADLNVPAKDGNITDTTRIDRVKPTIDYLHKKGAKIVILSHFGRPKGEKVTDMSLEFLAPILAEQWGIPVSFAEDCIGDHAKSSVSALKKGECVLLENLRFHAEEEDNDANFAKDLASLGDIYINDAFSTAHRAHASTEGITHHLPTGAGLLMEAELNALGHALEDPEKPVAAIVGGAKISTKLSVLNNLVKKVDYLILGGGMANTFLYAKGYDIGKSLCEKDMAEEAQNISRTASEHNCEIVLPVDIVCVKEFKAHADHEVFERGHVPEDMESVDAGPKTIDNISKKLENCKTVLWNGPLGVFEMEPFDTGTNVVARIVADATKAEKIISVAGGGDTVSALEKANVVKDFTYISTAGGAFLEWLEGKKLPGVAALSAAEENENS